MIAYRTNSIVDNDGTLTVKSLPFASGRKVQVIVLPAEEKAESDNRYPLRGKPYRFDNPTEPIDPELWEAAQ